MDLQAVTGQLYIVEGATRDSTNTPGLMVQSAPGKSARGRDGDVLFAHLSLSGDPEDSSVLAHDLLEATANAFFATSGSVTAALQRGVAKCNSLLLNLNMTGAATYKEGALCVAALHGHELYMAQAGEALAVLGLNIGTKKLPASAPVGASPLGRTAGLDVRLYHDWLQPGDTLLLADPRLAHVSGEALAPILTEVDLEQGMELLTQIVGEGSARLILVEFTDEPSAFIPEVRPAIKSRPEELRLAPPVSLPIRESDLVQKSAVGPESPVVYPKVEAMETAARQATSKAAMGASQLTGWTADMLSAIRPAVKKSGDSTNWALMSALAIIIPVITALIVTGVYFQRGQVVKLGEIRRDAIQYLAEANAAKDDPDIASFYFFQVQSLAEEGLDIRPGDSELNALRLEAQQGLDSIAGIARLNSELIFDYGQEANLTSVALGDELNGGIYVNDIGRNVVLRHLTGENYFDIDSSDPQTILFGQQAIGNHIAGQILDIFWRPQGNAVSRDGLAMLDARGALISFFPDFEDLRAVSLGLSSLWQGPQEASTFNERVYVLDPAASAIWRYLADRDGFQIAEELQSIEFIDQADIGDVVDFAIYSEDGSVVLLYGDGRIRRYANGRLLWDEVHLRENGLRIPVENPVAVKIIGSGLNSSIFVVDPGTERIIQLSLAGTFLAQFKAADENGEELFAAVDDFAVTENPFRIFAITNSKLYMAGQN